MVYIYGRRKTRIKKITDYEGLCSNCNSNGLTIEIYREYYHLFWIPLFPVGAKDGIAICNKCGTRNDYNPRVIHFESNTKTPIYLYLGLMVFMSLILMGIYKNIKTDKDNDLFISEPKIGDVYRLKEKDENGMFYYFLKVVRIQNDTIIVYPNTLQYFGIVSMLNYDDYFVNQELFYSKIELKELLGKGDINAIYRSYEDELGFNRIMNLNLDSLN